MRGGTLLVLTLLAAPSLAQAASFPCAKASTPTEKAICADQGLSKLDERVAASYREALTLLSGSSPEEGRAQVALKVDQRGWLGERNACGADLSCLKTAHERRVTMLTFRPDPGAKSNADRPANRYVGRFDHGGFMSIAALALRNGQLAVSVSGAEPTAGRWVCDFSGIGQVDGKDRLIVGTPDAAGNGLILEARNETGDNTKDRAGIDIPDNEPNRAASGNWCGMNGSFIFSYRRTP
jgi:Uncharacterized protein conserved in bacteria, putative lipoprotein